MIEKQYGDGRTGFQFLIGRLQTAELPRGIFVMFDAKEVLNQTKEMMKNLEVSPDA